MPSHVDPARFTGKTFTRKPIGKYDYRVSIDGLIAGRILQTTFSGNVPQWSWSITGPYIPPELNPSNGHADDLEDAQRAFKAKFWQWQQWAAQCGWAWWHGADGVTRLEMLG